MWQLTPGQSLLARQFGDEFVLYNDLSGDTHLLGASAMQALRLLQPAPASFDAVADALALADGAGRDDQFDAEVDAVLAQLAALALVSPLHSA